MINENNGGRTKYYNLVYLILYATYFFHSPYLFEFVTMSGHFLLRPLYILVCVYLTGVPVQSDHIPHGIGFIAQATALGLLCRCRRVDVKREQQRAAHLRCHASRGARRCCGKIVPIAAAAAKHELLALPGR